MCKPEHVQNRVACVLNAAQGHSPLTSCLLLACIAVLCETIAGRLAWSDDINVLSTVSIGADHPWLV